MPNLYSCFKKWTTLLILISLSISCARRLEPVTQQVQIKPETPRGDNYKIGVILPLTGKYAVYGKSTLHGIECASGIFTPCESPINAELIVKDDVGLPEKAAAAVEELVNKNDVNIIIGPLSSSSVAAAAQKAQSLGIPLISLSQKEGITQIGDNIFSVAMTATSQVKTVTEWAVSNKKIKNFGIVYPVTLFGNIYKDLFTEALSAAGGKIVMSQSYGETTLDFGGIFKQANKKYGALFIPDSYRAVGFIASTMLSEGIDDVQLIGINRWNNPELVERGGEALQGAVFVDGFFDASTSTSVQRFVTTFEQAYGMKPTILEAQSYDAAKIAIKALQSTGGAHPQDIKAMLANLPDVEGSTGSVGFDSKREPIKRLFLLIVKGENIIELSGYAGQKIPSKDKYGTPAKPAAPTGTKY